MSASKGVTKELSETAASGAWTPGAKAQERSLAAAGLVIGEDIRWLVPAGSGDEEGSTCSAGEVSLPTMQAISEAQTPCGAQ